MQSPNYSEFIGISPRAASLIEAQRISPEETKDTILLRVLSRPEKSAQNLQRPSASSASTALNLGQGAKVEVGEKLYLFLSEHSKKSNKPDGIADVRERGLAIDGKLVAPSKGSYLHPAMLEFQRRRNHRNSQGEIISLSAWRQWYVLRNGRLVRLNELKDPALARTRSRTPGIKLDLDELEI